MKAVPRSRPRKLSASALVRAAEIAADPRVADLLARIERAPAGSTDALVAAEALASLVEGLDEDGVMREAHLLGARVGRLREAVRRTRYASEHAALLARRSLSDGTVGETIGLDELLLRAARSLPPTLRLDQIPLRSPSGTPLALDVIWSFRVARPDLRVADLAPHLDAIRAGVTVVPAGMRQRRHGVAAGDVRVPLKALEEVLRAHASA